MISHHDQRRLDAIIRSAIIGVFREFLKPIVETEEFHTRLASTIAARCVAERVPKPAMTRPIKPIFDADEAREAKRTRQREWKRKSDAKKRAARAATDGARVSETASEPVVNNKYADEPQDAHTVVVVPAAVVPAPHQPPVPTLPPMPSRPAPTVITTTTKDVRAWLIASMKAGGLTQMQAEDRVGFMTHDQALAEANQRRARAGHPPFAFLGARSAA